MQGNSYTEVAPDVIVCNDCGAFAATSGDVEHNSTCRPGESQHWEEFYNQPEPEEELVEKYEGVLDAEDSD